MSQHDPRVDAYLAKSAEFAKPILGHLRALVHAACPEASETIKWGFPHFEYHGLLCHMAAFKKHCAFGFWHKAMRGAIDGGKAGTAMGQLGRIESLDDLPSDAALKRHIKEAMKLNAAGVKSPRPNRAAKKPLVVPADIKKALAADKPARATFDAFSPSHRREYVEWITDAKQPATRQRRIAQMLELLAEGKSRNWKYKKR